ncbi:MAG: serine hydrolase [Gemmatimonadota bacterium]|nr:serine hydrolase [Gemmatimonadota bacterium]
MSTASQFLLAATVVAACAYPPPGSRDGMPMPGPAPDLTRTLTAPLTPAQSDWVERTLAGLSLRERVGQMVHVWVLGDYVNVEDASFIEVRRWITEDKVGGVTMSLGSPIEVAAKVNTFQRMARVPLLVASDVEPGLGRLAGGVHAPSLLPGGSATLVTTNMAIGASGRDDDAYRIGRIVGREARAIGITVAFAPTVDVNNNPANPVINTRSFGEEPRAVARLAAAFVRGVQEQGVLATAKHFPGHGDTDVDSHLALPIVQSDRARLDSVELVPFRASIAAGVGAVMTAHIALPALDEPSTPATLVPKVITGLLRDTLGFRGMIFTDALTMEGVGQGYPVERSAVLAVQAGADILLKPSSVPRAIDAVVNGVDRGEIPAARIEQSARRTLEMKARLGLNEHRYVDLERLRQVVGAPEHWTVAREVAARAVTLLRDTGSLVPAPRDGQIAVISYAPELEVTAGRAFAAELRVLAKGVSVARITPRSARAELDSLAAAASNAERIVITTHVRTIEGEGRAAIPPHIAAWIDELARGNRVVVIANGNPYVIRQFPRVGSYMATYGIDPSLERASARALVGAAAITGRAPISLPGFFAHGDGISRSGANVDEPTVASAVADSVRRVLRRAHGDSAFPGAYVVVGTHDSIYVSDGIGMLDWSLSPRPDEHTIWDLASLTKVVGTTSAMMQLVAQGTVGVDTPAQRYLPELEGPGKERVTVRHLLTHSSGLPAWRPLHKEATSPESAMAIVYATPLDTVPGARTVYSDLGVILLGKIVERVSGEPLDRYLAQNVFAPLGMSETGYRPDSALLPRIAPTEFDPWRQRHLRGEVHDENAFALGGVAGHAGLFSSAHDLARFAQSLLAAYRGTGEEGGGIVPRATLVQFTTVQDSLLSHRALGWETASGENSAGRRLSRQAFGHTGFTGTSVWIDPQRDLFIILLSNRVNPTRENRRIGAVRVALADAVAAAVDANAASPILSPSR